MGAMDGDKRGERLRRGREDKRLRIFFAWWLGWSLTFTAWTVVIYVALHFIVKWW